MGTFGRKGDDTNIADRNSDRGVARSVNKWLHPQVYAMLVALTLWFVVWTWSFAGAGITNYLLVIVSGFIFVVLALTLILSRVGHKDPGTEAEVAPSGEKSEPFPDWAKADFDTQAGRLNGIHAATQILLPIGAAAVGMAAFGLVFLVVEHGGL